MSRLEIIRDFLSPSERCARTLRVLLPDEYDRDPARRFPVAYMHDGQNLFDHPDSALEITWGVNGTLDELTRAGTLEPWIVVAIDHRGGERIGDLTPWPEPRAQGQARADLYVSFVVDHLRPYVDRVWRTRPGPGSTATIGSSLGGLVSLYLALRRPDVFGRVGALSPSVMWASNRLFSEWNRAPDGGLPRVYLDAGAEERLVVDGREFDYGGAAAAFAKHLRRMGFGERELKVVLEPGGQHHERDWRRRLPAALAWLLAPTSA